MNSRGFADHLDSHLITGNLLVTPVLKAWPTIPRFDQVMLFACHLELDRQACHCLRTCDSSDSFTLCTLWLHNTCISCSSTFVRRRVCCCCPGQWVDVSCRHDQAFFCKSACTGRPGCWYTSDHVTALWDGHVILFNTP